MYETWFQLARRPFASAPSTSDFYPAQSIRAAQEACERCAENNSGPCIVVGDSGTGKTMLALRLTERTNGVGHSAVVNAAGIATRKELLQHILFQFDRPYQGDDEGHLRLSLIEFLTAEATRKTGRLLVIDDAHRLSISLLEELHTIADLAREGAWCVNVILIGLAKLEESLAMPSLSSFNQRVAARCYLRGWNRDETVGYVSRQLEVANANHVVAPDAVDHVYDLTAGVPRLVNQICDHAFVLAAAGSLASIDRQTMREAWSDLQQMPLPEETGSEASPAVSENAIVEFGSLEDSVERWEVVEDPGEGLVTVQPSTCGSVANPSGECLEQQWELVERRVSCVAADFPDEPNEVGSPSSTIGDPPFDGNPFLESFDEEEIVLDRFSMSNASLMSHLPSVATRDGLTLVETLQLIETLEEAGINPRHSLPRDPSDADEFLPQAEASVDDAIELPSIVPGVTDHVSESIEPSDYFGAVETQLTWSQQNMATSDLYAETVYEIAGSPARCILAAREPTVSSEYAVRDEPAPTPADIAVEPVDQMPAAVKPGKRQFGQLFSQLARRSKNQSV